MDLPERKATFAGWLGLLVSQVVNDEITPAMTAERLRFAADAVEKWGAPQPEESPPQAAERLQASPREVEALFEFWGKVTSRPNHKLTHGRRRILKRSLRDFSAAQLQAVIRWAVTDEHYSGDNDRGTRYDTIETMFRSTERIESLLEKSGWVNTAPLTGQQAEIFDEVDDLVRQREEATEAGEIERANELVRQIRALRRGDQHSSKQAAKPEGPQMEGSHARKLHVVG